MRDAEQSVIGCILLDRGAACLEYASTRLSGKMFSSQELGLVFSAMLKLRRAGKHVDIVTLLEVLGNAYKTTLVVCAETVPSLSAFENYVDSVLDGWRVRTMQELAARIAYDEMSADEMLAALAAEVRRQYGIVQAVRESTEKDFTQAMMAAYAQIMQKDTSLKTGLAQFDAMLGGFQRGCLYFIAARPGKGKTDFALQLAVTLAKQNSVSFQSMEMTTEQLMHRVLSRALAINSVRIRDRDLDEKDFAKLDIAARCMKDLHIVFDDAPALTMEDVLEKAERRKPDVMFLDYLGMMRGDARKAQWEQTQDITHALKALAKKQNMAVIALVQLNREVDKRSGKPTLADLRGGGSVEADADGVLFMNPDKTQELLSGDDGVDCGVIVAKNRYGGCGELPFYWQPQYHRYSPIEARRMQ